MTTRFQKIPGWVLKCFKYPPQALYALGLGTLIGGLIMLLKTRGRKSGKMRTTPLQYEMLDGDVFIASMRGRSAAWYRNLIADPHVAVRIGRINGRGIAERVDDPKRVVAFLQERRRRRPFMINAMLKADGLKDIHDPDSLAAYAAQIALVRIRLVEA